VRLTPYRSLPGPVAQEHQNSAKQPERPRIREPPRPRDPKDQRTWRALHDSNLKNAITRKLSVFLLKLGKGFAFVARQKRLSFEDEEFFVDLVRSPHSCAISIR
jgi:hypothetical protein